MKAEREAGGVGPQSGRTEATEVSWLAERKWLRIMEPRARAALQAGWEALGGEMAPAESGLVVVCPDISWAGLAGTEQWAELPPLWVLGVLPNSVAGHVSRTFQFTGPVLTCAAAQQAWEVAEAWVADGAARQVLVIEVSSASDPAWARWEWVGGGKAG
ncbi:MAG: hypothetical protein OHK005_09820 [Candidatus Methylacidiphilales bacterium]